jgi:hypothetical protein
MSGISAEKYITSNFMKQIYFSGVEHTKIVLGICYFLFYSKIYI